MVGKLLWASATLSRQKSIHNVVFDFKLNRIVRNVHGRESGWLVADILNLHFPILVLSLSQDHTLIFILHLFFFDVFFIQINPLKIHSVSLLNSLVIVLVARIVNFRIGNNYFL